MRTHHGRHPKFQSMTSNRLKPAAGFYVGAVGVNSSASQFFELPGDIDVREALQPHPHLFNLLPERGGRKILLLAYRRS